MRDGMSIGRSTGTRPLSGPVTRPMGQTDPLKGTGAFVRDVFVGGGEAVVDMAKGLWQVVTHPIQTAKGMGSLAAMMVRNPGEGLRTLGAALVEPYKLALKEGRPGKAIGRGIVEIGSLFLGPAEVVQGVKSAANFGRGAVGAAKAGATVGEAAKAGYLAAKWSGEAGQLASRAQQLARMGHVAEATQLTRMAGAFGRGAHAAKVGNLSRFGHYAALLERPFSIRVAGQLMSSADLLARSKSLVTSGRLLGGAGLAAAAGSEAAEQATRVQAVARSLQAGQVLDSSLLGAVLQGKKSVSVLDDAGRLVAGGAGAGNLLADAAQVASKAPTWERFAQTAARFALANPIVLFPISPAAGLALDALGRIGSVRDALATPEDGHDLARKHGLADDPTNIKAFMDEVSSYAETAIGPDVGSPDKVRNLQWVLSGIGYDVRPTGQWDEATSRAVIDFKRRQGMHQGYLLADDTPAINEYVTEDVVQRMVDVAEGTLSAREGR
ncbi:MAG: peptidoglycan-binding domain-containing protein [Candidatus Sericytochromatia bacterium]|nr:peptidoglycan-binding domain-containing protein [Candidatus Sericytochromatia bacterium]